MSPFNSTTGFNSSIIANATNGFVQASPGHSTGHELPLQPRLTPVFGVGGALLMLTSIPYAFASLKFGWLYMSMSCAYLCSICFTVLVVDVMSVPDQGISDRDQGGYLALIVLPGIAIGAFLQWYVGWLARRAGCVVGGFCMAMWIETLCPGGLIKTSGMTALLIGVMCVVSVGLSIPMLKRWAELVYMIFSAFAGSTALVLGIDCFSRAGLKEFWIYTWHFNRVKLFGFETKTYPITKNMKAEIAFIPIVFALALVIQYKTWKVVRARKEREAATIAALREDQEKQALDVGRALKMATDRDLAAWEARNKDSELKIPDVNQKPVDPPSLASRAGQKFHSAKDSFLNKLKPDHSVLVPVTSDAQHQHDDEISTAGARKVVPAAGLDTSQSKDPVVVSEGIPAVEEEEFRIPPSVIPILERLMATNRRSLNEDDEEIRYTLRPTSKRPPPILPQIDFEVGTPWDEIEDANMRSISPSSPGLAERFSFSNSALGVEDTKEQPRDIEGSHEDENVPTVITLSEEDLSEWEQHMTGKPDVDERNATAEHSALENLDSTIETLQYAHNRPTSEIPGVTEGVKSSLHIPELAAFETHGQEEVMSRTQEWSKTLTDAEPNPRASSMHSYEAKDEPSLWKGFEGTYATKSSAERLEEDDVVASQPQQHILSRASAIKRRSRDAPDFDGNTAILPMPVKSARVSKHNLSLPALDTGATLLATAATRKAEQKKQRSVSVNFSNEENQGVVARRNFGSHGKFASSSSDLVESTDLDEITLSQARRALHTRATSNSQGSSIYSHGPYTSSSMSGQSPDATTARTTPIVSSPVYVSPTTSPTGSSPAQACPPFVMVAPPLRNPYPLPPCETLQPSSPPYWYSNGAFSPGHQFAPEGVNNQATTSQEDDADFRLPQRMSAPGPIPTLMARVEFDEHSRRKNAEKQVLEQRRGIAAEAAKAKQREKQRRRRTLEIEEKMRAGQLDQQHKDLISKMQRQAMRNIEKQENKYY